MANEDPDYLEWIRRQPCCVPGCGKAAEAHHPRHAVGLAQRAHDHRAIPLCPEHHGAGIHRLTSGFFKGWSREQVRAFCDREGARFRERYLDPRAWEHDGIPF